MAWPPTAADRRRPPSAPRPGVLDPDTGYLRRVELTGVLVEYADDGSVEDRTHQTTRITYHDVGDTDVERPAIGGPSALELVWDVLYY